MHVLSWATGLALVASLAACNATDDTAPATDPAASTDPDVAAPPPLEEHTYDFRCGDLAVTATYHGQDAATVVIGDRTFAMSAMPAASGARYGDGEGNELWTKGQDEGILILSGEDDRNCSAAGPTGG